MRTSLKLASATGAWWLLTAAPASAQEITRDEFESLVTALDTVWVAAAAALVLLMHLGFGMLEAGLTRSKNAANIVGKNMMTVAIGAVGYWAIGAGLAYGADRWGVVGTDGFWNPAGLFPGGDLGGTGALFQLVFAATAATIVSGAVAERIRFWGYAVLAVLLTAFVYPIISHWHWGGGWLAQRGFYDFAGSTIVHLTGGAAALAGVMVLGARRGKYTRDGRPRAIPGHSIPLAVFGVLVLWFGWFGFNGGSTLAAFGQAEAIGTVLLNTTVAAGAGALAAAGVNTLLSKKPDPAMIGNGALAGLVGITAGPDLASGMWALVVGLVTGTIVVVSVMGIDRLRLDDPVGAISVHGVCGFVGTLFVGVYSPAHSVGIQAYGSASVAAFAFAATALVLLALKVTVGIRVSEQEEVDGLDMHEHGVAGYPDLTLGPTGPAPGGTPAAGEVGLRPAPGVTTFTPLPVEE